MKKKIILPLMLMTIIYSCKQSAADKGKELGEEYCKLTKQFKNTSVMNTDESLKNEFTEKYNSLINKQKTIQADLNPTETIDFLSAFSQETIKCNTN